MSDGIFVVIIFYGASSLRITKCQNSNWMKHTTCLVVLSIKWFAHSQSAGCAESMTGLYWLSIKTITGPDPAKFTESTEGSGPGLRNLSENDDLSVPECSSGSGSNR